MIASMTGFARRELAGPFGTLVCEIRSVNHRFLDAIVRLPESCRALEPELRPLLSRELKRGKVDCTLHHRAPQNAAASPRASTMRRSSACSRCVRQLARELPEQHVRSI